MRRSNVSGTFSWEGWKGTNGIIGQYGGDKETDGVEQLEFLENDEMKTLSSGAQKSGAQWTWASNCKYEGGNTPFLTVAVEDGSSEEIELNFYTET